MNSISISRVILCIIKVATLLLLLVFGFNKIKPDVSIKILPITDFKYKSFVVLFVSFLLSIVLDRFYNIYLNSAKSSLIAFYGNERIKAVC